ncbi:sugar phosphate isomerase/epimerase [Arsenicicoccus piscis]|uniref:Inosose dehydratase n=1 Tax=Arsenicicoccus piscis TaxID=673954 RepID=A0ABQ6HM51_9MICO|nr:sugar phosphate isomerase/epimerase [Arsenicicoccus piscis]MCH8627271.1 sugar phosphate isomerase/epimerase [Arsenicicoccus piscis]GMA18743.1 inosose dehydratase [Arsenicicoccus piscis]
MSPAGPGPRISVNPIPYWARDGQVDKSKEVFDEAFADFQQIGFTAVKADLPEGMSAEEYRSWIGSYGLAPAISTVMAPFTEDAAGLAPGGRESLERFAHDQRSLGLDTTMVIAPMTPTRMATPAVGVDYTPEQLDRTTDNLATVCKILLGAGLYPTMHPHVGSLVETERELRHVLDELEPAALGFGPDTGHMRWAGMDPAALIRDYADRVRGIHIKDVFADHLPAQADSSMGYHEIGATKRLWVEPGHGVVDFDAVMAAMPAGYAGDYMIEVDVPSVPTRLESHQISYDWAQRALAGGS